MKKKTKKYFVGGAVNTGLSAIGGASGMGVNDSQMLGSAGQAATGIISGNPMDMIQGATGMIGSGISMIGRKKAENKADTNEFNSLIKNQMEDGGRIPRQTENEFQSYPERDDITMNPMIPRQAQQMQVPKINTPEADLRPRGLQENLYRNLMTNKYDGAPRSIPRGERINPAIVSAARAEDSRNNQIQKFYTDSQNLAYRGNADLQSIMSDPEMGQVQKLPYENGGDLLEFGGFTHDDNNPENINEGSLIKSGQDGNHVVEKDETYKDGKVYSNNKDMPVPDGKYKGKTFAQASKLINKIADERPNDKIFTKHKDNALKALFNTQESIKQDYEMQEEMKMRCGGKMYYKGGKINEGDFDVDDISDDEIQYLNSLGYNIEVED